MPSSHPQAPVHHHKGPYDENLSKKLAKRASQLLVLDSQVLAKRREIEDVKARQTTRKYGFAATTKLDSWQTMYNIVKLPDGSLRPPDKTFNVRVYSNMDRNMWEGGERGNKLRYWFQKDADKTWRPPETFDAERERYVVPNPNPRQDTYREEFKPYVSKIINRTPYSVPAVGAGEFASFPHLPPL